MVHNEHLVSSAPPVDGRDTVYLFEINWALLQMKYSITVKTLSLLACICSSMIAFVVTAEQHSVRPGVNRHYQNPDWQQWVNTFERPGREVYDKRYMIVDATGVKPGMSVADIGAGTGLFTRLFAQRVGPEGQVYAVDISQPFIENIMRSTRELDIDNVIGIVNSEKDALLPPASIDLAFLVDTYHHFEYPASMLSSLHRSLKSKGRLVVIDFKRDPRTSSRWVLGHVRAGKNVVIDEITRAGFRLIDDKPMLRSNYYLVFSRLDS
jgi:ubiquinone/menaquinone biosynthesis C-methylase UbiE